MKFHNTNFYTFLSCQLILPLPQDRFLILSGFRCQLSSFELHTAIWWFCLPLKNIPTVLS